MTREPSSAQRRAAASESARQPPPPGSGRAGSSRIRRWGSRPQLVSTAIAGAVMLLTGAIAAVVLQELAWSVGVVQHNLTANAALGASSVQIALALPAAGCALVCVLGLLRRGTGNTVALTGLAVAGAIMAAMVLRLPVDTRWPTQAAVPLSVVFGALTLAAASVGQRVRMGAARLGAQPLLSIMLAWSAVVLTLSFIAHGGTSAESARYAAAVGQNAWTWLTFNAGAVSMGVVLLCALLGSVIHRRSLVGRAGGRSSYLGRATQQLAARRIDRPWAGWLIVALAGGLVIWVTWSLGSAVLSVQPVPAESVPAESVRAQSVQAQSGAPATLTNASWLLAAMWWSATVVAWLLTLPQPESAVRSGADRSGNQHVAGPELGDLTHTVTDLACADDVLHALAHSCAVCVVRLSADGRVHAIGPGLADLWHGFEPELPTTWLDFVDPRDRPQQAETILRARAGVLGNGQLIRLATPGSRLVRVVVANAGASGTTLVIQDVHDDVSRLRVLTGQAERDPLTGLAHARAFHQQVASAVGTEQVAKVWAVLACEIRVVSTGSGCTPTQEDTHWAQAAQRLTAALDAHAVVGRTAATQISVLLAVDDVAAAKQRAQVVAQAVCTAEIGSDVRVAIRVGVAVHRRAAGYRALLADADAALKLAQAQGWGAVCTSSDVAATPAQIMPDTDFELCFNLHADLASGQPVLVEAHLSARPRAAADSATDEPATGPALPVDLAAHCKMVQAAAQSVAAWRRSVWPDLALALLVDEGLYSWQGYPDLVDQALVDAGLPPNAVVLVLPGAVMGAEARHEDRGLQALRGLGVRTAVTTDDRYFLDALRRHDVDELWVGSMFGPATGARARSVALLSAVTRLARDLGSSVVVQGVSAVSQARRLHRMGASRVYGPWCGQNVRTVDVPAALDDLARRASSLLVDRADAPTPQRVVLPDTTPDRGAANSW